MKIQLKFLILLISVVAALFLFFLFYSSFQRASLIDLFKSEQAQSQRVFNTILDIQSGFVRVVAQDYTVWDDMRAYMASGDPAWAKDNLDTIIDTFKVDAFWVYRLDGTLLYNRSSLSANSLASLAIDPRLFLKKGSVERFFVKTNLGLCEIYAATVHPTGDLARKTPPAGYFLVGRLWNASFLNEISNLTGGVVSMSDVDQKVSAASFAGSYDKGVVILRRALSSWDGKEVSVLEMRTESPVLRNFNKQLNRYIIIFFIIGLFLVSSVFSYVFRWFTHPLRLIAAALEKEDVGFLKAFDKSRDEFGAIAGLINSFFSQREQLFREIQERRHAEEKLSRAAGEWRTTFDCINEQVSVMDKNYRISRVNLAFAQHFNMDPDEITGKVCYELLGRGKACPRCPYRRIMTTKNSHFSEYYCVETGVYSEVTCSPILDASGDVTGAIHIVKDITSRKDMEKQQRLAVLGRLVADMAHEVNNPLMVISGRGQLSLMEQIASPDLKENLTIIIDECQRAKEIIQRLLKFAKPSVKDMRRVNIQTCIDTVIRLIEHQFSVSGIAFIRHYLDNPPFVSIDDRQMQEVLMNLFNNAREAMPKAGTISVIVTSANDCLTIEIRDTGSGMAPQVKKRIYEPFFTTKDRGTGLGLSVCYGIIKSYGGSLEFVSEQQSGTSVFIKLPIAREQSAK
ncbi:MAG: ATP-binding protein [Candidatus Omnitrophota bacterium]